MRILIVGDSFAADWQKKYPDKFGWPNLLAKTHIVDNLAQAGCSEYRIYKQLKSASLDQYDVVIISHTSPYRIYTEYHPDRCNDILHHSCDLLYSDTKNLAKTNAEYKSAVEYFEKFFSLEYAEFCYHTTIDKIKELLIDHRTVHLSHLASIVGTDYINFSELFEKHQGSMNHYDDQGNNIIYNKILEELNK
jgi:hypothetical protein